MSTYRFRLETVLRLRRADEERARIHLAAMNTALSNAIAFRDREIDRLGSLETALGHVEHEQFVVERHREDLVAASIIEAKSAVNAALADAALAQVAWTEAARAVEVLERLDEKRRAEHQLQEQRREALETDDIVSASGMRRSAALQRSDER